MQAVWEATRRELPVAIVRDMDWYAWRYLQAPAQVQRAFVAMRGSRPVGICVLQARDGRQHLVDVCAPAADWAEVIAAIAAYSSEHASLEITILRGDAVRRGLTGLGFIERESVPFLVVTPADEAPRAGQSGADRMDAVYHEPANWTYLMGDVDVDRVC